ncbi:hypothetical protein NW762_014748 [Fusarium torreyae]|uniref:Uncharacterized protein n=1 Tax=Fusarium torreyae TaxID=1237075 RepID=A0A9W8RJE6_9HYPO|nr:hypothetical protein NW762_014748 [Fusarium torreyae]
MTNTQKRNSKSLGSGPTPSPLSKRQKAGTSSGPRTRSLTNTSLSLSPGIGSQTPATSVDHTELEQAQPIEESITVLDPLAFKKSLDAHLHAMKSLEAACDADRVALENNLRELAKLETSITEQKHTIQTIEVNLQAVPQATKLRDAERNLEATGNFDEAATTFVEANSQNLGGATNENQDNRSCLIAAFTELQDLSQERAEDMKQDTFEWQSSAGPSIEAELKSCRSQLETCEASEAEVRGRAKLLERLRDLYVHVLKKLRDERTVDEPQHELGWVQDHRHGMS